ATDVFDVELLPELLRQFLRDQPSREVGYAAGRKWDDDLHRLGRILLREGRAGHETRRAEHDGTQDRHHRNALPDRSIPGPHDFYVGVAKDAAVRQWHPASLRQA